MESGFPIKSLSDMTRKLSQRLGLKERLGLHYCALIIDLLAKIELPTINDEKIIYIIAPFPEELWTEELFNLAYNLNQFNNPTIKFLEKLHTKIVLKADKSGKILVKNASQASSFTCVDKIFGNDKAVAQITIETSLLKFAKLAFEIALYKLQPLLALHCC
ncbi:unnamed protein product [Pieris macdunnoughi]|uniref:Uncharacterized protein n=1 Tax=Pieris macdunnoughi TaxID=345717 RepID=A0A821RTB0_9NEOP|nr:unnamed protein product [Pieris macdunnoughi]